MSDGSTKTGPLDAVLTGVLYVVACGSLFMLAVASGYAW